MTVARWTSIAGAALLLGATAANAAPPENTLVVGMSADASTFDPAQISSRDNSNIAQHIFTTLYKVNVDGSIVPNLAESHEIGNEGKTITFKVKAGQTCEDGEPLTAEDVAYSFNRAADPKNAFTGNTPGFVFTSMGFQNAEAPDDTTVAINIARKSSLALGFISEVYVHCKDSYEKMSLDDATISPVSSGSYRLAKWERGSEIVLEKRQDPGGFETIVYRVIPEASTRTAELLAGNVDIITNVAPDQVEAVENSNNATVQKVQGTRRIYVGFNQKDKFDDEGGQAIKKAEVRRALQYAVDVPAICAQLLNFECERATGLVNPPNDNPNLEPYPYEPDTAEKLLDEAGYPRGENGVRFKIKLQAPRGRYLNDANVALAIGQYLSDVGVETEVELLEWASVYVPLIIKHDAGPLFLLGSGGGLWNPLYDMSDLATIESGPNYTEWKDPRWFSRWDDISKASTPEEERKIIDEMLKVFYEEGPWLHLYFQPDFYGVSNRIEWQARRDEHVDLWDAKLK